MCVVDFNREFPAECRIEQVAASTLYVSRAIRRRIARFGMARAPDYDQNTDASTRPAHGTTVGAYGPM